MLHLSTNRGPAAARNAGARHATTPYIFFLDADDYFEDGFLSEALQVIEHDNKIGAVSSFFLLHNLSNVGRITATSLNRAPGGDVVAYLIDNRSGACALVRKDVWQAIGGYDEKMRPGHEDWEFWIRLTAAGNTIHVLKYPYYHYHTSATGRCLSIKSQTPIYRYIAHKHKALYKQYARACFKYFWKERPLKYWTSKPPLMLEFCRVYAPWYLRIFWFVYLWDVRVIRFLISDPWRQWKMWLNSIGLKKNKNALHLTQKHPLYNTDLLNVFKQKTS